MSEAGKEHVGSTGLALFVSDVRRLAGLAAKIGAILAIVCHLLPPHYRPICEQLASLCRSGD